MRQGERERERREGGKKEEGCGVGEKMMGEYN